MLYVFDDFTLDPQKCEIYRGDDPLQPEARIFELAFLLVSQSDRMVSKDEIVDNIWNGRAITDNSISTVVKALRKLLGDDGKTQKIIKTVHGRGYRCVAPVQLKVPAKNLHAQAPSHNDKVLSVEVPSLRGKPSIAVLPFQDISSDEVNSPIGYAIPTELISEFSKMRWLSVTARASSFQFRHGNHGHKTIRDLLNVQYVLSGVVEVFDAKLRLSIELCETQEGRVIWSEFFDVPFGDIPEMRSRISASVVAALEIHIPSHEAGLARSLPPEHLDAWSEFHLGLHHVNRFNRTDNEIAIGYFKSAISKQPDFSRAHAGLSFSAFQSAFLNYTPDKDDQIKSAITNAERSVELDPHDPFANYNLGRSFWLKGEIETGASWMTRSTDISPNFAQGHYGGGLMRVLAGETVDARAGTSIALSLSPLDPLKYAMLATHSMSFMNEEKYDEAVSWAELGARSPAAHHFAKVTAAIACELAGSRDEAKRWASAAQTQSLRKIGKNEYFSSFPYTESSARHRIQVALGNLGID